MKLTISFSNYELQNKNDVNHNGRSAEQFKAQHAEVTGAFKMQGTGIMINTKLYNTMTIFS